MSRTIDERVLQMEFDNKRFEKGAAESIATLEKFNKACQMNGASTGFANLDKAIENINNHFTIFGRLTERVMDTVVNKISSVASSVTNLSKSLSFDQVGAGFSKYEEIISSTQTMMSALSESDRKLISEKGMTDLEYINTQIKRLNQYTDETSYNLTDMTSNVGKFMSAGIDLDTAVSSMEGIANLAARSGANVEQASRAMYNLSQAMGVGALKTQDWMSIENANMATKEFKEQLISTAKELGKFKDYAEEDIPTLGTFRETLKDGWIDTEVLTTVLTRYNQFYDQLLAIQETSEGMDMTITDIISELKSGSELGSKWIKEYGIDLDSMAAKAFLAAQEYKSFSDAVSATKDAASTAWMNIFTDIFGDLDESKDLWSRVGDDMYDAFVQPVSNLKDVFDSWKGMGGRNSLIEAFDNLREAVDSVIGPIKEAAGVIFGLWDTEDGASKAGGTLLVLTNQLKKFTKQMVLSEEGSNGIKIVFTEIFRVVQLLSGGFMDLVKVGANIVKFFGDIVGSVFEFLTGLTKGEESLESFSSLAKSFDDILSSASWGIGRFITRLKQFPAIGTAIKWLEWLGKTTKDTVGQWAAWAATKYDELAESVKKATGVDIRNITEPLMDFVKNFKMPTKDQIWKFLNDIFDSLKNLKELFTEGFDTSTPVEFFKSLANGLRRVYDSIKDYTTAQITNFLSKKGPIQTFIQSIKDMNLRHTAEMALESLSDFFNGVKDKFLGVDWKLLGETTIVGAMAVIVIKFKKQIDKLLGLGKDLKTTFKDTFSGVFQSFNDVMGAAATSMKTDALVKTAEAIAILAGSAIALSAVDSDALARVTVALLALMLGLSKLVNAKSSHNMSKTANILDGIKESISGLAESIAGALKSFGTGAMVVSLATALIALGAAIHVYENINWGSIAKAGAVLAGLIAAIAGLQTLSAALNKLNGFNLSGVSKTLIALPVSLLIMASAVKKLGDMDTDVNKALSTMSGITLLLSALIAVAATAQVVTNGNAFDKLSRTLLAITASITILGILPSSITGIDVLTKSILAMSSALAALTAVAGIVKWKSMTNEICALAKSLESMSGLVKSLYKFNFSIAALMAVISIFPDGLAKLADSINKNASTIASAIAKVFALVLTGIVAYKAKYIAAILLMVTSVIEALGDNVDPVIDSLMKMAEDILNALSKFIGKAAEYVVPAVVNVINTIATAINNNRKPILDAIGNLWSAGVGLISEGLSRFTGLDYNTINGLVDFGGKTTLVVGGINKLISALSGVSKPASSASSGLQKLFGTMTSSPATIKSNYDALKTFGAGCQNALVNVGNLVSGIGYKAYGSSGLVGALGKAVTGFGSVISSIGVFLPQIALATAAVSGLAIGFKFLYDKKNEAQRVDAGYYSKKETEALKEEAEAYSEAATKVSGYSDAVKAIFSKYNNLEELGKQYDSLTDKSGKAAEAYKKTISQELSLTSDQVDELIQKYGSLEEAIKMETAVQQAMEVVKQLQEDKQQIQDDMNEKYSIKDRVENLNEQKKKQEELNAVTKEYNETIKEMFSFDESGKISGLSDNWITKYNGDITAASADAQNKYYDILNRKNAAQQSYDEISKVVEETDKYVDSLQSKQELIDRLNKAISESSSPEDVSKLADTIKLLNEIDAQIVTAGNNTAEDITKQANDISAALKTMVEDPSHFTTDDIESYTKELEEAYRAMGLSGITALQEGIDTANKEGNTKWATVLDGILTDLSSDTNTEKVTVAGKELQKDFFDSAFSNVQSGDWDLSTFKSALAQQLGATDFSDVFSGSDTSLIDGIVKGLQSGSTSITDAITQMTSDSLKGSAIDEETATTFATQTSATIANSMKSADYSAIGTAIQNGVSPVMDETGKVMTDQVGLAFTNADVSSEATTFVTKYGTAITNNKNTIGTAATTVVNAGKSSLNKADTYSSGVNFLRGFSKGLESMSGSIGRRCYTIAQNFVKKFNEGLDEHSPSKETAKSGVNFMLGFSNAIKRMTGKTAIGVSNASSEVLSAFNESISYALAAMNSDMDLSPTITPVLDLSQIQNGSEKLGSMFNSGYSTSIVNSVITDFKSPQQTYTDKINSTMSDAMAKLIAAQQQEQDATYTFNIPLEMNGRQVARATRSFNRTELDNLNTILNRKEGIK